MNCSVDLICGPGNKWVTAAKSIVSGVCGIDMLAGPSEVLEYGHYLGMAFPEGGPFLWIAEEGAAAPLPGGVQHPGHRIGQGPVEPERQSGIPDSGPGKRAKRRAMALLSKRGESTVRVRGDHGETRARPRQDHSESCETVVVHVHQHVYCRLGGVTNTSQRRKNG